EIVCELDEFQCDNKKCVPLIWRCDSSDDCGDGSDEVGCSKPAISKLPPPLVHLPQNDTLNLTCAAGGVPTPVIEWIVNGSYIFIPPKCAISSVNGTGKLICENMQFRDQGTYTCRANNIKGSVQVDTLVVVRDQSSLDGEDIKSK
ncbi:basement membrane proteoglycan-like, partial [Anoplophora glabripennis]|uniref:basement membrane proteoglycan-like n=1 Tax=Anoplophora glabripennis TaxID=217634 RepID=UPI000C76FA6F